MLQKIDIENYAIIKAVHIDFSKNLNIITGETGAGKSILVGALSLVLGERAESNIIAANEKKMMVEVSFLAGDNAAVKLFLKENDLDVEDEIVLRREITLNGKSRAFVNDTPVNLSQIKKLGSLLVDLHQQFDTLEIGDNNFQREVVDAFADNAPLLKEYHLHFQKYGVVKRELEQLLLQQQNANTAADYNSFLYNELEEAALQPDELEQLDDELKLLSNAENIKLQLSSIYYELVENEDPLIPHLKALANKLSAVQQFHTGIGELSKRLTSVQVELADISDELDSINSQVQSSPERIQIVNDRILLGYRLLKKHQVQTTSELLAIKDALSEKLKDILSIGDAIAERQTLADQLLKQCTELAKTITANRKKITAGFEKNVNDLLIKVGMPNARFKVAILETQLNEYGADTVEFLFNANLPPGEITIDKRFEPLRKVASGGELSRIMLCVKSLVARKLQLPTLIFDEIDTGISGEAAKQVGEIMKSLSWEHQVIAITHQPQIAAKADAHYFVYKSISENRVTTSIKQLTNDERITTIAQMLSGEKPTAAAMQNAREMVSN